MPRILARQDLLRWRIAPILTATMILLTLAFIATITVLDISRARRIYHEELENRGRLLADQMNVLLADPLYLGNVEEMVKTSSIVASQPDVEYVHVFSAEGVMLADSTASRFLSLGAVADDLGRQALAEQRVIEDNNDGVVQIARPVTIGNQVVGGVQIGLRSDVLDRQVRGIVVEHVRQGILLTAIAAAIAYVIARQFSRPVASLVDATNRMTRGDLSARVHNVQGGELRELAGSFNQMAGELESTIQNLQESRSRIVGVQEGVRREIATHLHGRVQARLLVLRTQLARFMRSSGNNDDLEGVVEQLDDLIQSEISDLSRRLYPSILRRGLIPAIQSLTDTFATSLEVSLDISDRIVNVERLNRDAIPETVRLAAYRVAEDALTNVLKHAAATSVVVRLDMPDSRHVRLTVEDNGSGFDTQSGTPGLGLEAMRDYAGAVGGRCEIRSVPGEGSVVTALLPL
jgi:signal transduction histidine kinase